MQLLTRKRRFCGDSTLVEDSLWQVFRPCHCPQHDRPRVAFRLFPSRPLLLAEIIRTTIAGFLSLSRSLLCSRSQPRIDERLKEAYSPTREVGWPATSNKMPRSLVHWSGRGRLRTTCRCKQRPRLRQLWWLRSIFLTGA